MEVLNYREFVELVENYKILPNTYIEQKRLKKDIMMVIFPERLFISIKF